MLGALAFGCKKDEPAPTEENVTTPASAGAEAAKPSAPANDVGSGADRDAAKGGKGGIAALATGLIGEIKAAPGDPLELVPASAVLVGQLQVVPLKLVPGWEEARAAMLRELGDKASAIESLRECGLDVEQVQQVTFAMVEGKHAMGIVSGPGFGLAKNHECALGKLRTAGHDPDYEIADHEGAPRLVVDEGDAFGYLLGDDMLLVVDKEVDAEVAKLRAREGKSVRDGDLGSTLGRVDAKTHAWFAARIVGFLAAEMGSTPMGKMQEMWGSAHFDSNLDLSFGTRMPDAAAAEGLRDTAQKGLDEAKAMLPMLGVSAATAAKVAFGADGDRFTFALSMTPTEIESVRTALAGLIGR